MSKSRKNHSRSQSTTHRGGGPKTEAGKAKSSLNALRHGYTSHKAILLCNENEQELREFSQIYFDRFLPATPAEGLLVEEVIAAAWRIRRLWHAEAAVIDADMCRIAANPDETCDLQPLDEVLRFSLAIERLSRQPGNPLMLIQRYARSLRHQYNRALRELRDLQSERLDPNNNPFLPNELGPHPEAPPPSSSAPPQPADPQPLAVNHPAGPPAPIHAMRPARRVLVYRPNPPTPAVSTYSAM